jgi:putative membrane protein
MKKQIIRFFVRWFANSSGLYLAAHLFHLVEYQDQIVVIIVAGLVLSILNALIKPVLVILALPAIALTLGIFTIIINGFIVYLVTLLYGPLQVQSFWGAVLVGMVIGLVNYIVTIFIDSMETRKDA